MWIFVEHLKIKDQRIIAKLEGKDFYVAFLLKCAV